MPGMIPHGFGGVPFPSTFVQVTTMWHSWSICCSMWRTAFVWIWAPWILRRHVIACGVGPKPVSFLDFPHLEETNIHVHHFLWRIDHWWNGIIWCSMVPCPSAMPFKSTGQNHPISLLLSDFRIYFQGAYTTLCYGIMLTDFDYFLGKPMFNQAAQRNGATIINNPHKLWCRIFMTTHKSLQLISDHAFVVDIFG